MAAVAALDRGMALGASLPWAVGRLVGRRTSLTRSDVANFLVKEAKEMIAPVLFFTAGFNIVVLTTQLILNDYLIQLGSFLAATGAALVVGKAVLIADALPFLRRFDRAPLIQPILFKTSIYFVVVFLVRLLEKLIEFAIEGGRLANLPDYFVEHFSWHRFAAIQIWIFVLFLIYVTASELNALFGDGELRKIFFTHRASELQQTRRQRLRSLARLSHLADSHSPAEFRDPHSEAHKSLVETIRGLMGPTVATSRRGAGQSGRIEP
jgi:hypothetical protein